MLPDARFIALDKTFWAHVRTISECLGYTVRLPRMRKETVQLDLDLAAPLETPVSEPERIKAYSVDEMAVGLKVSGLRSDQLYESDLRTPSEIGAKLHNYFAYRARLLDAHARKYLMDATEAKKTYDHWKRELNSARPAPLNKQTGDKKDIAFLTGLVNMFIDTYREDIPCSFDPRKLTAFTRDGTPFRTLARRVDGFFPDGTNPVAAWEIKEYYYTTTFGSRVADGVYETLLDGFELQDVRESGGFPVKHLLIVDGRYTWWDCGRSYLCRLFDMLHMGYVDEVLFGREVVERMPDIVKGWVSTARSAHPNPHVSLAELPVFGSTTDETEPRQIHPE